MLRFTKLVKYIPEFYFFAVFLKNRKIIPKIKTSIVTDYAALTKTYVEGTQKNRLKTHAKTDEYENIYNFTDQLFCFTVVPTKSDSDATFCKQLLSKSLTCTLHLS